MSKKPTVFVIYYSLYGHVEKLARRIIEGLKNADVNFKLFQINDIIPKDVLEKMKIAPRADDVPVIKPQDLCEADGI